MARLRAPSTGATAEAIGILRQRIGCVDAVAAVHAITAAGRGTVGFDRLFVEIALPRAGLTHHVAAVIAVGILGQLARVVGILVGTTDGGAGRDQVGFLVGATADAILELLITDAAITATGTRWFLR